MDSLVDNALGYATLSFMDAYSGYNQILMHPSDQNKTTFITDFGNYCYKVMPFGLKNAGATYQRLMDKVFAKQIGRNIEVYVDDMVAKTENGKTHIDDLAEIFGEIRCYNMLLNPEKCAFAVQGGRLIKWAIELSEFDIRYQSRGPIKSQFLANFIAELTIPTKEDHTKQWTLYVDGSSNNEGCGAGIHLEADDSFILEHSLHLSFKASNNQSEYEALIAGLRLCLDLQISAIKVYCDSLLIVQQEQDWRNDFIEYLQTGHIPDHIDNRKKFRRQASFFTIVNGTLYRQGYTRPLLKCLNRAEADIALAEAHEGICGTHTGARSLTSKIIRAGFFWPTLKHDSQNKHFALVEHPQTNGLPEAANKVILHALKKKLDDTKGLWAELIPEVLWGYNTTPQSTTKETPFRLVYGSEAMIPLEISQSSIRTNLGSHDEARRAELDIIKEIRDIATLRQRAAQQAIARRHNKSVRSRSFQKDDIVL
ncbi:uncharacterized protein [Arachis hypogaea]|uniref:uncharacterized protein n=1 Tax=Arachis hypogaea TaxID=3818 RepID=UPI003B21A089